MRIIAIDGHTARCRAWQVERDVNLFMLQDQPLQPGDYVLVHVGYAIQKVDTAEAQRSWQLLDSLAEPH